jgi:hypothetical protein
VAVKGTQKTMKRRSATAKLRMRTLVVFLMVWKRKFEMLLNTFDCCVIVYCFVFYLLIYLFKKDGKEKISNSQVEDQNMGDVSHGLEKKI